MRPMLARVAPIFGVPRVRQAAEYYRDVFGFELDPIAGVFQPDPGQSDGVYGIVNLGNASIHFQYRASFTAPSPTTRGDLERDAYVYVSDVHAIWRRLQEQAARIVQPLWLAPYGINECTVEDLNGYRISFGQPLDYEAGDRGQA